MMARYEAILCWFDALTGQPRGHSDRQQALMNALGEVHDRTRGVANSRVVRESKSTGHVLNSQTAIHVINVILRLSAQATSGKTVKYSLCSSNVGTPEILQRA